MKNLAAHWLYPDWPAPNHVRAVVTTRTGGYSQAPYQSFNLALHVGDDAALVQRNRRLLQETLQLQTQPQWLNQVHSTQVIEAKSDVLVPEADASYTSAVNVYCAVLTADCLPVLFCNKSGTKVAAAHAGWKGLQAGILQTTVSALQEQADNLLVWLGPAIGPQSFVVGSEVRELFLTVLPQAKTAFIECEQEKQKWHCNIYTLARLRLNKLGIQHIYGGNFCTYKDSARFYSYRREAITGRMASLIWLQV